MKKSTTLLVIMSFALLVLSGCKEKKNEPASPDTPSSDVPVQSVTLSISTYAFSDLGETLQLEATVLPENATNPKVTWASTKTDVATVSDNGLVTSDGDGTATIIAIADGKIAICEITVDAFVKDFCGNKYKIVKIGEQVWMAENLRCNKYDTQSERPGSELNTFWGSPYYPYYSGTSNKSAWKTTEYSENLSNDQISKLGYLYNWAAAVALANTEAAEAQTEPFGYDRQGICPNGWHVPSTAEWDALGIAMGGTKDNKGNFPEVGKKLKTTSGWHEDGNGTDEYSFAALPAGYGYGYLVREVGASANFWTSTPYNSDDAYNYVLNYQSENLSSLDNDKSDALSVRCVKN